jgi:hypothetical protein
MLAAIPAALGPDALTGVTGELLDHGGRDSLLSRAFGHRLGAVGIGLGPIAE